MNLSDVQTRVKNALRRLNNEDASLMLENLNERSIAHQLAVKLGSEFSQFNVDAEYNGNSQADGRRKEIQLLNIRLEELKSKQHRPALPEDELINLSVTPDIIVHRRLSNEENLLILEIKKSTNGDRYALDFDKEKMKAYTQSNNSLDGFIYQFGLLLTVGCSEVNRGDELIWYENGVVVTTENLSKEGATI